MTWMPRPSSWKPRRARFPALQDRRNDPLPRSPTALPRSRRSCRGLPSRRRAFCAGRAAGSRSSSSSGSWSSSGEPESRTDEPAPLDVLDFRKLRVVEQRLFVRDGNAFRFRPRLQFVQELLLFRRQDVFAGGLPPRGRGLRRFKVGESERLFQDGSSRHITGLYFHPHPVLLELLFVCRAALCIPCHSCLLRMRFAPSPLSAKRP